QAEFGPQAAVGFPRHAAGDECLGIDDLPVLETRLLVRIADFLDEGALVDGREQAGALQVGGDDLADLRAKLIGGDELGDRDRHGLDIALVDSGFHQRMRRGGKHHRRTRKRDHEADQRTFHHYRQPFSYYSISLGSKFTMTSLQASYFSTGRFLNGADRITARSALPSSVRRAVSEPPEALTLGRPIMPPVSSSFMLTVMITPSAPSIPA